jgi:hypothetical protein
MKQLSDRTSLVDIDKKIKWGLVFKKSGRKGFLLLANNQTPNNNIIRTGR